MLRRRLLALLLCLVAAGLPLAAEAASAAMQADQACMHHGDGKSMDCGGTDPAANACGMHCAAGVCIVTSVCSQQTAVPSVRPLADEAMLTPDCRAAPETAPPKAPLS